MGKCASKYKSDVLENNVEPLNDNDNEGNGAVPVISTSHSPNERIHSPVTSPILSPIRTNIKLKLVASPVSVAVDLVCDEIEECPIAVIFQQSEVIMAEIFCFLSSQEIVSFVTTNRKILATLLDCFCYALLSKQTNNLQIFQNDLLIHWSLSLWKNVSNFDWLLYRTISFIDVYDSIIPLEMIEKLKDCCLVFEVSLHQTRRDHAEIQGVKTFTEAWRLLESKTFSRIHTLNLGGYGLQSADFSNLDDSAISLIMANTGKCLQSLTLQKLSAISPRCMKHISRHCKVLESIKILSCNGIRSQTNFLDQEGYYFLNKLLWLIGPTIKLIDLRYSVEMCDAVLLSLLENIPSSNRKFKQFLGSRTIGPKTHYKMSKYCSVDYPLCSTVQQGTRVSMTCGVSARGNTGNQLPSCDIVNTKCCDRQTFQYYNPNIHLSSAMWECFTHNYPHTVLLAIDDIATETVVDSQPMGVRVAITPFWNPGAMSVAEMSQDEMKSIINEFAHFPIILENSRFNGVSSVLSVPTPKRRKCFQFKLPCVGK